MNIAVIHESPSSIEEVDVVDECYQVVDGAIESNSDSHFAVLPSDTICAHPSSHATLTQEHGRVLTPRTDSVYLFDEPIDADAS